MGSAGVEETEGLCSLFTPDLRLTFRWAEDRWTHAIEVGEESGRRLFAESVEQSTFHGDPTRVSSPTYQDGHAGMEDSGEEGRLWPRNLLVGGSGPHHFSAAFTLYPTTSSSTQPPLAYRQTMLSVSVADRCRTQINSLGATYHIASDAGVPNVSRRNLAIWTFPKEELQVALRVSNHGEISRGITLTESLSGGVLARAETETRTGQATHVLQYDWLVRRGDTSIAHRWSEY